MRGYIKKSLLVIYFLLLLQSVFAQDFTHVISNSENWKDVYSAIHYANLKGAGSDFLVSTVHGNLILNNLNKQNKIRVITSKKTPYVFNYPDMIKAKGFADADEITVDEANLELISELEDINNFIVVGDSYGYNVVAVAPYAVLTKSWVFLANRLNIYDIDAILSKRAVEKIIIYGYVDREVRNILDKYNPEIIDTGDKFKDNIEIVKKYLEIKPAKQVVLTNGEFIEREIMSGAEPVLFTGRENVPDQIRDYLKNSNITVGVLIGNELVGAATNIRRSAGISVMVKFARGARAQTSGIAAVEGLDLFPLPTPYLKLVLQSVKYNKVNSQLEVTYKSESNVPAYFKGVITLISGLEKIKVGDIEPIFIAPGDFKTVIYSVNITSLEKLKAEIFTLYGETPSALDRLLEEKVDVSVVEVIDKCRIDVKGISYNKQKKYFVIKTKNIAEVDCWVDVELKDLIIDNMKKTIGTEGSTKIPAGKTKKIIVNQELTEEDIEKNPFVELIAYYGEKEDSLVNMFRGKFELKIEVITLLTYAIIALISIIIILIIIILIIKKREREEEE